MTAHPNAHILARLAEIAKTDREPWKRLERYGSAGWITCNDLTPVLNPDVVFRIKPTTVNIGGVELEGPIREAPEKGTKLWLLFDHTHLRRICPFHFPHRCLNTSGGSTKGASLLPKKPETNTRTHW